MSSERDMKAEDQACGETLVMCFEVEEDRGEERGRRRRSEEGFSRGR